MFKTILLFWLIGPLALLYFCPAIIAWYRWHGQRRAIFALNLLTGWTFFGWVGALVWSLVGVDRSVERREWYQRITGGEAKS